MNRMGKGIAIGTYHPSLGFMPLIFFRDMDGFKQFLDDGMTYYNEHRAKIPNVFARAFDKEGNDGKQGM